MHRPYDMIEESKREQQRAFQEIERPDFQARKPGEWAVRRYKPAHPELDSGPAAPWFSGMRARVGGWFKRK